MAVIDVGPGLAEVLAAQQDDDQVVAYPQLEHYAGALWKLCDDLGNPCLWPVGQAAERLTGATVIISRGRTRVRGWSTEVSGQRVLLVTVAAVTPLALWAAADQARRQGAIEVLASGVRVGGVAQSACGRPAYFPLGAGPSLHRRTA